MFCNCLLTLTISLGPGLSDTFSIGKMSAIVFSAVLVKWQIEEEP